MDPHWNLEGLDGLVGHGPRRLSTCPAPVSPAAASPAAPRESTAVRCAIDPPPPSAITFWSFIQHRSPCLSCHALSSVRYTRFQVYNHAIPRPHVPARLPLDMISRLVQRFNSNPTRHTRVSSHSVVPVAFFVLTFLLSSATH